MSSLLFRHSVNGDGTIRLLVILSKCISVIYAMNSIYITLNMQQELTYGH